MLWLKAFHIIFVVTWFSGLFYLPRLFVYHAMTNDKISIERFKVMERKLYYGITLPSMLLTLILGAILLYDYGWQVYHKQIWLHIKLALVVLLVIYNFICQHYLIKFKHDKNTHGHVFYRIFNEIPVLFLIAIVILVVLKPI